MIKVDLQKKLLDQCLRDNEVWYEQMGKNLRMIEDLAASKELEDDEDFLIREPATADMGGYLCHYDRVSTYGPGHM